MNGTGTLTAAYRQGWRDRRTGRTLPRRINGGDLARFSYLNGWRDAGSAARRLAS